jgi:transcription termination factor NusA
VGEKRAADLYEEGLRSTHDVARATVADLVAIEGISEKRAGKLIEDAIQYTREKEAHLDSEKELESGDTQGPDGDERKSGIESNGEA